MVFSSKIVKRYIWLNRRTKTIKYSLLLDKTFPKVYFFEFFSLFSISLLSFFFFFLKGLPTLYAIDCVHSRSAFY